MNTIVAAPAEQHFEKAALLARRIADEVGKAVVGQREVIDHVLVALLAGGHVLLEGVPGVGKTLLVRALAKSFAGDFGRIQFTPDLMPADVTGHVLFDQPNQRFVTRRGPIFTNLLLADEINRAPAKTQAALLEAMQEGQVSIEGEAHRLAPPFMVLATQNPIEQEGTYALPEAQLDRFLLKVRIDAPAAAEEVAMVQQVTRNAVGDRLVVDTVTTVVQPGGVLALQTMTAQVQVDETVVDYAVRLVRATRDWNGIAAGAGPRGGISLVRAARAAALLAKRDYATPDDVKHVLLPALRHRITLAAELEIEGLTSDEVLRRIAQDVPAPRR